MNTAKAQDFNDYQWKNRLIVIVSSTADDARVEKQLHEFENLCYEIEDRKLKLHLITPSAWIKYSENIDKISVEPNSVLYDYYSTESSTFEVLLVGLDGTVKSRFKEVTQATDFFDLIDGMQMRKAEMRRKKN